MNRVEGFLCGYSVWGHYSPCWFTSVYLFAELTPSEINIRAVCESVTMYVYQRDSGET